MSVGKIKEALDLYRASFEAANKAERILSGGPADYYLVKLTGYVDALFSKYAPFQIGDLVLLIEAPKTAGTGWDHCAHFLIPGAQGVVQEVDYINDGFVADVMFESETLIDQHGTINPVSPDRRHTFRLRENILHTGWRGK
jgi:hypothetical protein